MNLVLKNLVLIRTNFKSTFRFSPSESTYHLRTGVLIVEKKKKRKLNTDKLNLTAILINCNTKDINTNKKYRYYRIENTYMSR
jgi:hypothetical protein